MAKNRMDKMTTIATRKEWAAKVMYKHIELMHKATRKAQQHIDNI